jgi:hypothetical protein
VKRVLLTWNTGGTWIPKNVLESHKDAARRWNAEYVSIEKATDSPFADKAILLRTFNGGDQVAWIDGDAIIRFDCPSLFDVVPQDCFGGVPNFQGDTHDGDPWRYAEPDWQWMVERTGRLDLFYDPTEFINGGVFVFCPELHHAIWDDEFPKQPNAEQTMLNFRADMLGVKRKFLARTFNRIGPQAWAPGPMSCFIQHLAAFRFLFNKRRREDRMDALDAIDWTSKARLEVAA